MSDPIRINLTNVVGQIAGVLIQPYAAFIAKLHADRRITDEEIEGLRQEFENQFNHLGELVMERQRQDSERDSLQPEPVPE